jgi:hypothetical protein
LIFYLTTRPHAYTIGQFLESWGKALAARIKPIPYEQLTWTGILPGGTYIFSDIERLAPREAELAAQVWEQLAASQPGIRLLNHPTRSMRRYELLRTLHDMGRNDYNVYHLVEGRAPRLPVFLRCESDHCGARTPLLHTPEELRAATLELDRGGQSREDMLITEFCDTSDQQGIVRKYSAFAVGERIVPRHLFFSRNWMLKYADLSDEAQLREERDYIEGNPHEALLKELFRLARLDYGRIDYNMLDGRPQVWEINTNPMIISAHSSVIPERHGVHQTFLRLITAAFEAIDSPGGGEIRLSLPRQRPPLKRRLKQAIKLCLGRPL